MNQVFQSHHQTIAVSHPGGTAKQFKVQVQDTTTMDWRQHSAHPNEVTAREALDVLLSRGCRARVVHYRLPSAA